MKIKIDKDVIGIYKKTSKNINSSLEFLLNSIDIDSCLSLINKLKVNFEETVVIEIDENNIELAKKIYGNIDENLLSVLVVIAAYFPEI